MKRSPIVFIALSFTLAQQSFACGEITPNAQVTKIVKRLAYSDFPKASDIFSLIRIESSYDPDASNESERESSHGLMQVQDGPFDVEENIARGVARLREYYMLTHSKKGAVESYNIGPKNYLNHKLTLSGEAYYDKYLLQKKVYVTYEKTGKVGKLGKTLGCGKQNGIPDWLQAALVKDAPDEVVEAARIKVNETKSKH